MSYRRYVRRTGARKPSMKRRIYIRPWMRLEERITSVDYNMVRYLDDGVRVVKKLVGYRGDLSMIIKSIDKGVTVSVHHIVVDRSGLVKHIGLKGVLGWDPGRPGLLEFRDKRGRPREWRVR